jgi:protoheme IX farnesyltransferase
LKETTVNLHSIPFRRACSFREWINLLLDFAKIKISLLATFSMATGYLLVTGKITIQMFVPIAAVFLLACGSCGLNQYQEREIDQRMERTKTRPIPSGRLDPERALWISLGLIIAGTFSLFLGAGNLASGLGLFAVLWYNLLYTPLKRKTAFAALPGALVGAIPPMLGWVAGGGEFLDSRIGGIALFFFIWQIPHFLLLLLDSSEDYEKAGLPSITRIFSINQIKGIIFIWLLSTGISSLIIPLFGFLNSVASYLILMTTASWLFWNSTNFLRLDDHNDQSSFRTTFMKLNIYAVLVISFLFLDRLLSS